MANTGKGPSSHDLNDLPILGSDGDWGTVWKETQRDNRAESGLIRCYFKNIEAALIDLIRAEPAEVLVGCIAWFTSPDLSVAFQTKAGVSLILDKSSKASSTLFQGICGLPPGVCAAIYPDAVGKHFEDAEDGIAPVRYVGFAPPKDQKRPYMHNKFLVFCRHTRGKPVPYAVWTGSANFTINARLSFENGVFIRDPVIAEAYFNEWMQIMKFSEPADRRAPEPRYRFRIDRSGTTWPVQSRNISYILEAIYRVDNLIDRFLSDLINQDVPSELHDDLQAECQRVMHEVCNLAEALRADLDTRFVPESELNFRLGEIKGLLKSFSDVELVAEIEECLACIEHDLDEWGE